MERFWADSEFCSLIDVSEITCWESAVSHIKRKRGRFGRKTVTEERVRVAGTGVSSVTGRSGERSWAGRMFTNN